MDQKIITAENNYKELDKWIEKNTCKKILLVCDGSICYQKKFVSKLMEIENKGIRFVNFHDFKPNPLYESVISGVEKYRLERCDAIIAVGGGSAMDVAKCIKVFSDMSGDGSEGSYLRQTIIPNTIPFLVMPTTAGTGSEATRYAVIYYRGEKLSVMHESCLPGTIVMDFNVLKTLPLYQKKSTMMDALCHAIESFWSVNSTDESRGYSREAIISVIENMAGYLENTEQGNAGMLMAAHMAGKAINIAQTTAGHAMCYKITSLFRCAHGHAAALCDRALLPWMIKNTDKCIDPRGEDYLKGVFEDIAESMGCASSRKVAEKFQEIFDKLKMKIPVATEEQYQELKKSVNQERLKNHPIALDTKTIDTLYHQILR